MKPGTSTVETDSNDETVKLVNWLKQSMKDKEVAKHEETQNATLQVMFKAMVEKTNITPCPDTGANIFKGLGLVDDTGALASKAHAALTAVASVLAKRQHNDTD